MRHIAVRGRALADPQSTVLSLAASALVAVIGDLGVYFTHASSWKCGEKTPSFHERELLKHARRCNTNAFWLLAAAPLQLAVALLKRPLDATGHHWSQLE